MNAIRRLSCILACACLVLSISGCGVSENTVFSVDDLSGKTIGAQFNTTGYLYATDEIENATVKTYSSGADAVQALKQGKIDAVIIDSEPANVLVEGEDTLRILDDPFVEESYAVAYAKENTQLGEQLDHALIQLKTDGTLSEIVSHWIGDDADQVSYTPDDSVSRENVVLVMATNAEFAPYESMDGENVVGIDVDMMQAVCDLLHMELQIVNMEFDEILDAVHSGEADVGVAALSITPDRQELVSFTQSYATSTQVIIVRRNK